MKNEWKKEKELAAITYERHPGTGDAIPKIKILTPETTVKEIIEWAGNEWDIRITNIT